MFGFNPNLQIMSDILRVLDEQENFITSRQLLDLLGYSNLGQVKKSCRELKEAIENYYPEKEVELVIDKRHGMKLVLRSSQNLQIKFNDLSSQDLAFNIYRSLLFERTISTDEFCKNNYTSLSTLYRKIKEINLSLNNYGMHITFSQQLKINGSESTIRCFSFIYLYIMHRQISRVHWIEDSTSYLETTKKITDHLGIKFRGTQEESFGLLLFVIQKSIDLGFSIDFQKETFTFVDQIHFPDKPECLNEWKEEEWKFLLLTAYNSNLDSFDIPIDVSDLYEEDLINDFDCWISLFEKYFVPFDEKNKVFLYENFLKRYLSSFFFQVDHTLLETFQVVDFKQIEEDHPYYIQQFKKFWKEFSETSGEWTKGYFEIQSFLLCEYFLPLKDFLPQINIYIFTDLTTLFFNRIKDKIDFYFSNKYRVNFVETPQEAHLIIGTTHYRESYLLYNQKFIMIRIQLPKQDFYRIEKTIKKILLHD